jgi:hypothetical protein
MIRQDDPWRLPALQRFGTQLRDAESAERRQRGRRPRRWRPVSLRAAAVVVALALIAGALELVSPAGALSPINHAPAAAAQSRYVRFSSALEVAANGHQITRFTEQGELDFVTGDYATTLSRPDVGERVQRRRVGDVFYGAASHRGEQVSSVQWRAIRIAGARNASVQAPGGYTLMDPQVVFRVMAGARAPITVVGHEALNGVPTTHYRLSTSLGAFLAAEHGSPSTASAYENVEAELGVWLDGRGRPVRVEAKFAGPSPFGAATMTTLINFTDYGAVVTVRQPSNAVASPRSGAFGALGGDPLRTIELLLFGRAHAG